MVFTTILRLKSLSREINVLTKHQLCFKSYTRPLILSILFKKCNREYNMNSEVSCGNSWRGVPLSEIYGSQFPWGALEFPMVAPSYNHAVLYHVPSMGSLAVDRPPEPQLGHDKWDSEHVRMPCSAENLYPIEDSNGKSHIRKRWEIILSALSKPIRNSQELANAIISYNTKFKKIWKFQALHKFFNEYLEEEESQYFFDVTLPEIVKLALALPKLIQSPIPLLKQNRNHSVSLSQQQIASLLANAFFCTFPRRNTNKKTSEYASYPHINFNQLYETSGSDSTLEKLKCLCHYFRRVCIKVPVGVVTFCRRAVAPRACPAWLECDTRVASLPLHVDSKNTIEDAHGLIQVDFANKFLGGGVLGNGCVQEEIRFVICPELMISMLFTQELLFNEAVMIIGCERYSDYVGYGGTFQWSGEHRDSSPRDSSGRRRCAVLAIDALPYHNLTHQYRRHTITRELNKAWIGFSWGEVDGVGEVGGVGGARAVRRPGVASGNWGCGAFGGSPALKSLLQLMAAAHAQRPLAYYTFDDAELRDDIVDVYDLLSRYDVTVGQVYKYLIRYCNTDVQAPHLYSFLHQALRDDEVKSNQNNSSQKETSSSSETALHELSSSLQNEFLTALESSPDLFDSPDDYKSLTEVKIDVDPTKSVKTNSLCNETIETNSEGKISSHTSKLFEEMQKLDDVSGNLNVSISHTTSVKHNVDLTACDTKMSMNDNSMSASPRELKRKLQTKITDFYIK